MSCSTGDIGIRPPFSVLGINIPTTQKPVSTRTQPAPGTSSEAGRINATGRGVFWSSEGSEIETPVDQHTNVNSSHPPSE